MLIIVSNGFIYKISLRQIMEDEWPIYALVNYAIIESDIGLSTVRGQAVILTIIGLLSTFPNKFRWIFNPNTTIFIQKLIWRCRMQNDGHFVPPSMC